MKLKAFFRTLDNLYSPNNGEKSEKKSKFLVKYYCQANGFFYEIYHHKKGFKGRAEYTSKVFSFWNSSDNRANIMLDIAGSLLELKQKSKKKSRK